MADPADPFETEALIEQRARQRRWLRGVPEKFLEQFRGYEPAGIDGSDATMVEAALRQEIDRAMSPGLHNVLEEQLQAVEADDVGEMLGRLHLPAGVGHDTLATILETFRERALSRHLPDPADRPSDELAHFVLLAMLADDVMRLAQPDTH
jgi:hypothetical protein